MHEGVVMPGDQPPRPAGSGQIRPIKGSLQIPVHGPVNEEPRRAVLRRQTRCTAGPGAIFMPFDIPGWRGEISGK